MNKDPLYILLLFIGFTLSCGRSGSPVSEYVKHSDSVSVAFFVNDSTVHIQIKDKTSIQKLGSYIDGETIERGKCTDTGSIWFYENGKKKMQVDFSINPDCSYFSYMMNDKMFAKVMSEEANSYLTGIKKIAQGNI